MSRWLRSFHIHHWFLLFRYRCRHTRHHTRKAHALNRCTTSPPLYPQPLQIMTSPNINKPLHSRLAQTHNHLHRPHRSHLMHHHPTHTAPPQQSTPTPRTHPLNLLYPHPSLPSFPLIHFNCLTNTHIAPSIQTLPPHQIPSQTSRCQCPPTSLQQPSAPH